MFRSLKRKWRYGRQKDRIDILLMYIVSAGKIGVELPFEDNKGVITNRPVIGYNKTKVFIDVDHLMAWFYKDRITLTDDQLYAKLDEIEASLVPTLNDKAQKHIKLFKELEGKAVRLKHKITGQIYSLAMFRSDCGHLIDREDPPFHLPITVVMGLVHKVLYLEQLEILESK